MTRRQRLAEQRAELAARRYAEAPRGQRLRRLAEAQIARTAALRAGLPKKPVHGEAA